MLYAVSMWITGKQYWHQEAAAKRCSDRKWGKIIYLWVMRTILQISDVNFLIPGVWIVLHYYSLQGAKAISEMLIRNSSLQILELDNNLIDDVVCIQVYQFDKALLGFVRIYCMSKIISNSVSFLVMEVGILRACKITYWQWNFAHNVS